METGGSAMSAEALLRLLLVYAHLLFCVFALRDILVNDWKVLRRMLHPDELRPLHRRVTWLLSGLWATGAPIAAIDLEMDPSQIVEKPKIVAKFVAVGVLTLNGWVLKHFCFPRIGRLEALGRAELALVMAAGATSTASWLMAAFLGVARPLQDANVGFLALYGGVVATTVLGAVVISPWIRKRAGLASVAPPQP